MPRVRVKICGITRPEDAAAACRHGADAIGMVFHAAQARNVTLDQARAILAALTPFVTPVGLFVDSSPQAILDTAATLGIRTVQLNGDQTPEFVGELTGLSVIRAIRVARGQLAAQMTLWREQRPPNLVGVVLEPGGTKVPGGSGVANDWEEVIAAQRAGAFGDIPLIAAGGLKPETVAQVVRDVRPFAVDVSSGVESALREKSEDKIRAFINAVRSVNLD
jgi:phosphoribosylanthranilate isomerase